jgi:hypothetical protein
MRLRMGLFSRSKQGGPQPYQRLEILMELGRGSWYQSGIPRQAAVRSTFFKPLPMTEADDLTGQVIASVLVVGRVLVAHSETRDELASRLRTAAAHALMDKTSAPLSLAPWLITTEASVYQLWPWPIVGPEQLHDPVSYVADVFVVEHQGQPLIALHLAMGGRVRDTRVLAPSAAAIVIQTASNALAARAGSPLTLPLLLYGMDDYFVRNGYSIGGESYALLHALQIIRDFAQGKRQTTPPASAGAGSSGGASPAPPHQELAGDELDDDHDTDRNDGEEYDEEEHEVWPGGTADERSTAPSPASQSTPAGSPLRQLWNSC